MEGTEASTKSERSTGDQCALGASTRKTSTVTGTLIGLNDFSSYQCPGVGNGHVHTASQGKCAPISFASKRTALYTKDFNHFLALRHVWSLDEMYQLDIGLNHPSGAAVPTRVSAWSSFANAGEPPALALLNVTVVRQERVVLGPSQAAAYLHIDDGSVLSVAPV
jgi:hypothetical protein